MLGCPGNHPDQRALFYDSVVYSKAKIADFVSVLDGFKQVTALITLFQPEINRYIDCVHLTECVYTALQSRVLVTTETSDGV